MLRKVTIYLGLFTSLIFILARFGLCQGEDDFYFFQKEQISVKTVDHYMSIVLRAKPDANVEHEILRTIPKETNIVISPVLLLEKLWLIQVVSGTRRQVDAFLQILESHEAVDFVFTAKTTSIKDIMFLSAEIIVRYKKEVERSQIKEINTSLGVGYKEISESDKLYVLTVSKESKFNNPITLANFYTKQFAEKVEFASPNFYRTVMLFKNPDDLYYPKQWGLKNVNSPPGWDRTTGDTSIKIAVIDDGVDKRHPDLSLDEGYDVLNDKKNQKPNPGEWHGTAVSGLASAIGNNTKGISGILWTSKIVPIRAIHTTMHEKIKFLASDENLAAGIRKAYLLNADVQILCWGTSGSEPIWDAIDEAYKKGRNGLGCVIVAASGNDPYDPGGGVFFPASHPKVIAVGAVDKNGKRWPYSCFGKRLCVVAPSGQLPPDGDIMTTDQIGDDGRAKGDYYEHFGGTSAAAPLVGGLAGLILSVKRALTANEVRDIIEKTADDVGPKGRDNEHGHGRINVDKAVQRAISKN